MMKTISGVRELRRRRSILTGLIASTSISAWGCSPAHRMGASVAANASPVDVLLLADEADAALSIIRVRAAGRAPSQDEWHRLFKSQGYTHLSERESAMHRSFTDSAFSRYLVSDSVVARAASYERQLHDLEDADFASAARQALAYLPPGTPLRARVYLEIKPLPNSFVFTGGDSIPSIFLYVRATPAETRLQIENTIAHELHHIGTNATCAARADTLAVGSATAAERTLLEYLTAFGEGRAMLAAAGGADIHPHAEDPDSLRDRWDRDLGHAPEDIRELSSFIDEVLNGRIATSDSVTKRAASYFGYQGPWYTVGWLMAATVERENGRKALIGTLCAPVAFLRQYNDAAARANTMRGSKLPVWSEGTIKRLSAIARPSRPN